MREVERQRTETPDIIVCRPIESRCGNLTRREKQIVCLLRRGYSNKEIARELGIAISTVKWNITNILGKLGVATSKQLIANLSEADFAGRLDEIPKR